MIYIYYYINLCINIFVYIYIYILRNSLGLMGVVMENAVSCFDMVMFHKYVVCLENQRVDI